MHEHAGWQEDGLRAGERRLAVDVAQAQDVPLALLLELLRLERSPTGRKGPRGINTRVAALLEVAAGGKGQTALLAAVTDGSAPVSAGGGELVALDEIQLINFLQFREATLRPQTTSARPLCLVTGHNGYGKTALIRALQFALFGTGGHTGIGDPVRLLHAGLDGNKARLEVRLVLQTGDEGEVVVRRFAEFRRRGDGWRKADPIEVTVQLGRSDRTLAREEAKQWLLHRFPRGVMEYFVFDAESTVVQSLSGQLGETLPDVTREVEAALDIVPLRAMARRCRDRAAELAAELTALDAEQDADALGVEIHRSEVQQQQAADEIATLETRVEELRAQAGAATVAYESLTERLDPALRQQREALKAEVTDLAAELHMGREGLLRFAADGLPLLLLGPTIDGLAGGGQTGDPTSRDPRWLAGAGEAVDGIAALAAAGQIPWSEQPMPATEGIAARLRALLDLPTARRDPAQVVDMRPLQALRQRALAGMPSAEAIMDLERLQARLGQARAELDGLGEGPDAPGWREKMEQRWQRRADLEAELSHARSQLAEATQKNSVAGETRAALTRQMPAARKRARRRGDLRAQMNLASKVQACFGTLADQLRAARVETLERAATNMMRRTVHKQDLYDRLLIDRETLRYTLVDSRGQPVPAGRSTGERTLLALCLVYGLQRASGCRFPLIVEAPLKPLDAEHQHAVLKHFVAGYEGQTVLLVKPGEIPRDFDPLVADRVASRHILRRPHPDREESSIALDVARQVHT